MNVIEMIHQVFWKIKHFPKTDELMDGILVTATPGSPFTNMD